MISQHNVLIRDRISDKNHQLSLRRKIQQILSDVSGLPTTDFRDLHAELSPGMLDSLEYLEAIVKIEIAFSTEFSDEEVSRLKSIQSIINSLNNRTR